MTGAPFRLMPEDAERFVRLRRAMLESEPWAFAGNPEDDEALDRTRVAARFAETPAATFAVEGENRGELWGAASVARGREPKFAHRARIWGVFVDPAQRRRGLGNALMSAAIDTARSWGVEYLDLSVSDRSPEARRLYERLGFRVWGREPEATAHGSERYDEIHMTLKLEPSRGARIESGPERKVQADDAASA